MEGGLLGFDWNIIITVSLIYVEMGTRFNRSIVVERGEGEREKEKGCEEDLLESHSRTAGIQLVYVSVSCSACCCVCL